MTVMSRNDPRFRRGVKLDHDAILSLIRAGGQSHNAIARHFGCSSTTIGRIARAAGYTRGRSRIPVEVSHGDPRWDAWLAYWQTTDEAPLAAQLRRQRRAVTVQQDWPPETPSPAVDRMPLGTWSIAWGTPESAAWLCVLRRSDPNQAQSLDLGKQSLTRQTRWPPLLAPSGADQHPAHALAMSQKPGVCR